jgi:serine/threonine protein kinase
MQRLSKKSRSRLLNIETYKISCANNEIIGKKTLKSADESDDFVHVIQSVLQKYNVSVILKIHEADDKYLLNKELVALKKLINFENSVKYICDFSCMDNKDRWFKQINKPTKFCNQKEDKLHFIVMEYIENGDLHADFFDKNPSKSELQSVFLQIALAIAILGFEYKMYHGDLHCGNILLDNTDDEYITYKVSGKEYNIKSNGYLPKLVDYGRSGFYIGRIHAKYVLEDIYLIFNSMSNWTKDPEYKKYIKDFLQIKIKDIHTSINTFKDNY